MRQDEIHHILARMTGGRLSRREAIVRLAALGMSWSAIGSLLSAASPRAARAAGTGRRGESGVLKVLYWQAPTILNPHLAQGTKDFHASRICTEPLLTVNGAGVFTPVLAVEVPSRTNGSVAPDGRTVTYKLKQGVRWADRRPFTDADVVFTFHFISNKQTASTITRRWGRSAPMCFARPWPPPRSRWATCRRRGACRACG